MKEMFNELKEMIIQKVNERKEKVNGKAAIKNDRTKEHARQTNKPQ